MGHLQYIIPKLQWLPCWLLYTYNLKLSTRNRTFVSKKFFNDSIALTLTFLDQLLNSKNKSSEMTCIGQPMFPKVRFSQFKCMLWSKVHALVKSASQIPNSTSRNQFLSNLHYSFEIHCTRQC